MLKVTRTQRGFEIILHPKYPPDTTSPRLVQASSLIDEYYDDTFDHPGSSFLWFGENHHLNREEVAQLVCNLELWLKTGRMLPVEVK